MIQGSGAPLDLRSKALAAYTVAVMFLPVVSITLAMLRGEGSVAPFGAGILY